MFGQIIYGYMVQPQRAGGEIIWPVMLEVELVLPVHTKPCSPFTSAQRNTTSEGANYILSWMYMIAFVL